MEQKVGQPLAPRRIEAHTNQGWGFASAIIVLAIMLTAGAFYINRTRYHSPNDVLAPTSSSSPAKH